MRPIGAGFGASALLAVLVISATEHAIQPVSAFTVQLPSTTRPTLRRSIKPLLSSKPNDQLDLYDDDDYDDEDYSTIAGAGEPFQTGGFDAALNEDDLKTMTVPQLQQQLRLRGQPVDGIKEDLIQRLMATTTVPPSFSAGNDNDDAEMLSAEESQDKNKMSEDGKREFIDVTAYLDEKDVGKSFRSIGGEDGVPATPTQDEDAASLAGGKTETSPDDDDDDTIYVGDDIPDEASSSSVEPETWGSEARIVDDYEGRSPIVDGLSRTIVEYPGSNQTDVQAFVVASRDALKPYLAGKNRTDDGNPEVRLREIQEKREKAAKRPFYMDEGVDEGDETGLYADILHRDFSDWGKYSMTGEQISAQQVQGVIFLSDVYGAFAEDTKMLAEKIAFECQPVVVMVPDLFRGRPWSEDKTREQQGYNHEGQTYEEWRSEHSDVRVNIDIRAAAAVLRAQYHVTSIAVWGTCYGGGRALEVGAGYFPDGQIHDIDGTIGPPLINPGVVIAWYPTRYNARELFGAQRTTQLPPPVIEDTADNDDTAEEESKPEATRQMAVMAVFGGKDDIPGATTEDAALLKTVLEEDDRVKDTVVKVFPDQDHGFAHIGLSGEIDYEDDGDDADEYERFVDDEFGGAGQLGVDDGDAEIACLLSTGFMETYSRTFLPTTGPPIMVDEAESEWSKDLSMKDLSGARKRDVRQEIEDSLSNYVDEPLGGRMIDPNDEDQQDELIRILRGMEPEDYNGPFKIEDDDNLETVYAKLKAADPTFQLF